MWGIVDGKAGGLVDARHICRAGLQFLTHKDLILIQAATMAMLYNPSCCYLINGTVHIRSLKENYQPPEHLKDFTCVSLRETLKCTPDFILCF